LLSNYNIFKVRSPPERRFLASLFQALIQYIYPQPLCQPFFGKKFWSYSFSLIAKF
jgi:hypothetical protein